MKTIAIDPVTRIEGHARVLLDLDEDGRIADARFVVNELRGFERILVGMEADRMPLVTARICGVCPSSHHLAAVKAIEAAFGVEPPVAAKRLRELMYVGHFIHSHTLSLFVLQGPDLVLGLDAPPEKRNVIGVVEAAPEVAKQALRLRTIGQKINELVGGRGTHPVTSVPGGITFALDSEKRRMLEEWTAEALELAKRLVPVARDLLLRTIERAPDRLSRWVDPAYSIGTVSGGTLALYEGSLRVVDADGRRHAEFESAQYADYLVESAFDWSYMKPVKLKLGEERVPYRAHTLGRVNVADRMSTPLAQQELERFRASQGWPCHATLMHVWARLVELVFACERAYDLARDPELSGEARVEVKLRAGRGVAHVEAPRGALFHDYTIDDKGIVRSANLIVATQQNYDAINRAILKAAESYVAGRGDDALLNGVEFAIRCFDPCLSCATHAVGRMPLQVVVQSGESVVHVARRDP